MNTQHRLHHHWLGWIAMLAFASVLAPINIHIVIAQDLPEIVIAPADPGQPPAPPEAIAEPQASAAPEAPAEVSVVTLPEPASPPADVAAAEPVAAAVPVQMPDVPVTPSEVSAASEVSTEGEIGKLIPNKEPAAQSVANESRKTDLESVRTLSVEPGLRPMLPEDRPAWVGALPDFTSAQHFLYVGSLPTTDRSEVDEALDAPLLAAVRNYIDQEVVNEQGAANAMPVTPAFIRRNLIDNPEGYECELTTGQEPLFQKWVTVRITPEQRDQFRKWHTEATQRSRLAPLGVGLVAVLSVISLSHIVLGRFRGANPLQIVNQPLPVQIASRKARTWSTSARLMFFGLLLAAVMFAFLMPLFALTMVSIKSNRVDASDQSYHSIEMPVLHEEVRVETLDGGHRTIILNSKSHR